MTNETHAAEKASWYNQLATEQLQTEIAQLGLKDLVTPAMEEVAGKVVRRQIILRSGPLVIAGLAALTVGALLLGVVLALVELAGWPVPVFAALIGAGLGALYVRVARPKAKVLAQKIVKQALVGGRKRLVEKVVAQADLADMPAQILVESSWTFTGAEERLKDTTTFREWETTRLITHGQTPQIPTQRLGGIAIDEISIRELVDHAKRVETENDETLTV